MIRQAPSSLLDLDHSSRAVPLHAWSRADKDRVAAHVAQVIRAWRENWLADAAPQGAAEITVKDLHDSPDEGAQWHVSAPTAMTWRYVPDVAAAGRMDGESPVVSALQLALFGPSDRQAMPAAAAPLSVPVARLAWEDLRNRLALLAGGDGALQELALAPQAAPASRAEFSRWSGALLLQMRWPSGTLEFHVPHQIATAWLGGPRSRAATPDASRMTGDNVAPVRLAQAISQSTIQLRAMLGEVTLNLGDLLNLQLGDIVPLTHALDAPVQMVNDAGESLCCAWLGQLDGLVAVELASSASETAVNLIPAPSSIQ